MGAGSWNGRMFVPTNHYHLFPGLARKEDLIDRDVDLLYSRGSIVPQAKLSMLGG
jgi:hypothetical protein